MLEVKAADGFVAKLYVDGKTHLPMMLVWMDKEPLRMMMNGGGATTFVRRWRRRRGAHVLERRRRSGRRIRRRCRKKWTRA